MELITCGVLYFFNMYILTARSVKGGEEEDGGERRESGADFEGGGKLEREL